MQVYLGKRATERRKFSEKRRKLKASYRKREDPFSLYEENFFLRKRTFQKRKEEQSTKGSSGNYSQHANKESNDSRLVFFSLSSSMQGVDHGCQMCKPC